MMESKMKLADNVTRAETPDEIDVVEVRVNGEPWNWYTVCGDTVIIHSAGRMETVKIVTRRSCIPQYTP